jgi:hypothetical protein
MLRRPKGPSVSVRKLLVSVGPSLRMVIGNVWLVWLAAKVTRMGPGSVKCVPSLALRTATTTGTHA